MKHVNIKISHGAYLALSSAAKAERRTLSATLDTLLNVPPEPLQRPTDPLQKPPQPPLNPFTQFRYNQDAKLNQIKDLHYEPDPDA